MAKKWITIKLPEEITKIIDKVIDEKYLGYRNRADFGIDSIRRRLEEIQILRKNNKNK